jgi:hypothetical protein
MPRPSNDPGFGFSWSDSIISFGIEIEGMAAGVSAAFDGPTMPAMAPAPTATEESKNVRREGSIIGRAGFSVDCALWESCMVQVPLRIK